MNTRCPTVSVSAKNNCLHCNYAVFLVAMPISQMTKVLRNFSLVNCILNQVDGRKFGKFTEQPIMKNIKAANWQIKVW